MRSPKRRRRPIDVAVIQARLSVQRPAQLLRYVRKPLPVIDLARILSQESASTRDAST